MSQNTYSVSPHPHMSQGNFVGFISLHSFLRTGSSLASLLVVFSAVIFFAVIFSTVFLAFFCTSFFAFLAFSSAFFLVLQPFLLFLLLSLLSLVLFLCSFCSVASCFWRCFSSSWAKHSALVRRCPPLVGRSALTSGTSAEI